MSTEQPTASEYLRALTKQVAAIDWHPFSTALNAAVQSITKATDEVRVAGGSTP